MNNLIKPDFILLNLEASNKKDIITKLGRPLFEAGIITDINGYLQDVLARESLESTAVGFNVATPHAKSKYVTKSGLAFARLNKALQWDDDEEAQLIFLLAVPKAEAGERHLKILASLARKLMHADFRSQLENAQNAQTILELLANIE